MAPRRLKMAPDGLKMDQDGPEMAPRSLKMAPDGPKTAQDGPRSPEAPKAPKAPKSPKRLCKLKYRYLSYPLLILLAVSTHAGSFSKLQDQLILLQSVLALWAALRPRLGSQ